MSGITGIGTTFTLPNYHGELFAVTPSDTPLLSAAGGIGGGGQTTDTLVEWQKYDLRDPAVRTRLEGADAPTAEERVRANVSNRLQIFHEAVSTSYTKQAAVDRYAGAATGGSSPNPVRNEHSWQVTQALKQVARDVNYSFWNAVRNDPADNTTARQMAGLLSVMTTNARVKKAAITGASASTDTITVTHDLVAANKDKVVFTDVGASTTIVPGRAYWVKSNSTTASFKISATDGGAAITVGTATVSFYPLNAANAVGVTDVNGLLQSVYDNGGISEDGHATLFCGSGVKVGLTAAYAAAYGKVNPFDASRTVGGVSMDTIKTDLGTLNIKLDRALPQDALAVVQLEQIDPVFLSIPDKGVLFEEELAKTGSSEKTQIYGEIGLKYGNEAAHGVMRGFYFTS
jgi:hypothetical protein